MSAEVAQVVSLLWSTGLLEEQLREAIARGEAERDSVNPFAPPGSPGYYAWSELVTALRQILSPFGWTPSDEKNLSLVVSPCKEHALLVVAGDQHVGLGDPDLVPQPKRRRGEAAIFAVDESQMTLFDARTTRLIRTGPTIWFLLVYRVPGRDEVRAELSIPKSITETGFVSGWHYRHNLGTIEMGPTPVPHKDENNPTESTVEVKRKS
ncbi:hypothetical protein D7Y15_41380 [Corallococcus sp. AB030]|uniref:hypothetical protein n=1 Tax=Corallococcus sp. AB030 TaxID=2316716 RepID=UPI000EEDF43E|nr:hypothetical protein [Corallococcus sp. AB030]RKH96377.1 hypothetical protein D7Y15_41380 [Corallococcus sp. AB030]